MTDPTAVRLVAELGPTLVAALTGAPSVAVVEAWCEPGGPAPDDDAAMRLAFAWAAWTAITDTAGDHLARTWFVGRHPSLGGDTPIATIHADRIDLLMTGVESVLRKAGVDDAHDRTLWALVNALRPSGPQMWPDDERGLASEDLEDRGDVAAFDAAIAEEGPNRSWTEAQADLGWDQPSTSPPPDDDKR